MRMMAGFDIWSIGTLQRLEKAHCLVLKPCVKSLANCLNRKFRVM